MRIPNNQNILRYLQKTQTPIIAPCNGQGTCGKCKVTIHDDTDPLPLEKEKLSPKELASGVRLACLRSVDQETEITVLLESNPMHQSHRFSTPVVHDPDIKLMKERDHYSVYRDEIRIYNVWNMH
jgi:Na+-transporting NADH:ubiquinone oxidoreductase subunit NqrF